MTNQELFFLLQKNRQEAADILERPSLKGVKYSVVEKYSEQAHFLYELLQNADDVLANKVQFILNKEGLIFIHNGKVKFNVTHPDKESDENTGIGHINAITSIGNSSKADLQIGKFGVGFKSVFQYTNTPEIYEDEFKFHIDRFIVPILENKDHPERKTGETLFYFPFNNPNMPKEQAYLEISNKFKELQNPLMFIPSLRLINWKTEETEGHYSKKLKLKEQWKNIKIEDLSSIEQVDRITTEINYLLFTKNVANNKNLVISLVFRLNDEGKLQSDNFFPAYCFFPTKERTNLKFIIQAPFLLIDNRQGIKRGNKWNDLLINQLSDLLVKSIDFFKEKKLVDEHFFNVLPIEKDLFENAGIFYSFYKKTKEALLTKVVFPSKEGKLTPKDNSFLADNERILELLSSKQLSALLKKDAYWVFPSLTGSRRRKDALGNYLLEEIGIKEFTPRNFIRYLDEKFLSKQSNEWLIQFYRYISNSPNLWQELKKLPIIKTKDNQLIAPFNNSGELVVFLPDYTPTTFPVVNTAFTNDEIVLDFFKKLGLKEPDLKAEIELSIIPSYRKRKKITFKKNLENFIIFLTHYQQSSAYEQNAFIAKIKNLAFIEAKDNLQNSRKLVKSELVYVRSKNLKTFFENYKYRFFWLNPSFTKAILKSFEEKIVIEFLSKVGVAFRPRQILEKVPINSQNKSKHNLSNIRFTNQYGIKDYSIEGLENAIDHQNLTPEKSKVIWSFLLSSYSKTTFKHKGVYDYFYFTHKEHYFEPKFVKLLKRRAWLYKKGSKTPLRPRTITEELLTASEYKVDANAAQKLISALGISEEETTMDIVDWSEEERLDLIQKAGKYEEYKEFITTIPKEKLKQLLKEQQILEKKKKIEEHSTLLPAKNNKEENALYTKAELVAELNDIRAQANQSKDIPLIEVLEQQEQNLASLQDKLAETIFVETPKQKLQYANLMDLRDFAIELAHVIKTALSKVMNQALFFKEEFPNEEFDTQFKIYSQEMHYELQRLRRVVDFMLTYTEAEKYYSTFEVVAQIDYIFESLYKNELESENIIVDLDLQGSVRLHYNEKSFEDIISNLISNSIKALKGKKENKKIKCSTFIDSETSEFIILFSDNGYGVNDEVVNRIFDAYVTTTQNLGGAGIGLYIVKTKLKTLGGYIELIQGEFEEGATFKIALPLN